MANEAPERIWANPDAGYCTTVGESPYTTEYIRADLAALEAKLAERVKVKPLEWQEENPGASHMWAHSPVGTYTINVYVGMKGGSFQLNRNYQSPATYFYTEQQAKAAAQADFERRILSALED